MLLLLQTIPPPVGIWPNTVAGWASIILAFTAICSTIYGFLRMIERLNGYGVRLGDFEERLTKAETLMDSHADLVKDAGRALEAAMREMGSVRQEARICNDETQQTRLELGAKLDEARRAMERYQQESQVRMTELVTELKVRRVIGDHPIKS